MSDSLEPALRPRHWARLRYRADRLWDRGTWPVLLAVGSLTLLVVIASTTILVATGTVFTTEHSRTVAERFWQSLLRVIDPGTMASDVGWGPRLLSLMVTIAGILLFGTLIGTIATTMQARLQTLRRGRTIVLESGHLVILGWSPWIGLLVDDLTLAADARRTGAIVVLADEDRRTMEEELRPAAGDRQGPRLICRNGDPTVASELHRVNIREARTVIAIGSEAPRSDAIVATTVLAVGVACGGFSGQTVVAEIDDPAAAQTLTDACDGQVEVVGDDVIADLLAMWMANPGGAEVLRELLSFEHNRLTFCQLPESYGRSFRSVVIAVEHGTPIGIRKADGTFSLAPSPETLIAPGELLVCLTDGSPARLDHAAEPTLAPGPPPSRSPTAPQQLMVLGWNRIAPGLLLELDLLVSTGSTVSVICDAALVTAEEIAVPTLEHLAVSVARVTQPQLQVVSALAARSCSAIAVLACQGVGPTDADALTLATLMAVRGALTTTPGSGPFVVAELTDDKHAELAAHAGADETVARSTLLGDAIAFTATSPEARPVLDALQGQTGRSVRLVPAVELGLVGSHSFANIIARTYEHGMLALGTRSGKGSTAELRLRVQRSEVIQLGEDDEVAVIG